MANRLSEESVIAAWDSGHRSLPWHSSKTTSSLVPGIDLAKLLELEDPKTVIQELDRRDLYLAVVAADAEVALEVLPHLSAEQWTAIVDYEGWHEDRIAIHNVIRWLNVYKQHDVGQMFNRFKELDEEYQVALFTPYVVMIDEEAYEALSHDEQDKYRALPCNTLWYKVNTEDEKIEEFVSSIVEGGLGEDLQYTYSLLAHATYLPPNEDEDRLLQFRRARLEEDGFALPEESNAIFLPFDGAKLYQKYLSASSKIDLNALTTVQAESLFIDLVLNHVFTSGRFDSEVCDQTTRSFAQLANMIATACQVTPDDVSAMSRLMEQCQGLVSLGLEVLSEGRVDRAAEILISERPKVIFQFALSLVDQVREEVLKTLKDQRSPGFEMINRNFKAKKFGATLWAIDSNLLETLGLEATETLKGLFNRLPMVKVDSIKTSERVMFKPVSNVQELNQLKNSVQFLN